MVQSQIVMYVMTASLPLSDITFATFETNFNYSQLMLYAPSPLKSFLFDHSSFELVTPNLILT